MKKIIGILVALGLVLSLGVMATPVAADVSGVTASVANTRCEYEVGDYTIAFNITASLTEGYTCVCVVFPAGTTFVDTFPDADGEITIEGVDVFADEVTVDGTTVCFLTPTDFDATDNPIDVVFTDVVVNPAAGDYTLDVYTCRAPDSTPVASNEYTILPAVAEYEFVIDFSPTYEGLPVGFVPPMKACGQDNADGPWNTVDYYAGEWSDIFDFTFKSTEEDSCAAPCDNMTISVVLMDAPDGSTTTIVFNYTGINMTAWLDAENPDFELAVIDISDNMTITWESLIHVDSVGDYEICFYAECDTSLPCEPGELIAVDLCIEFHAYQWKDAYQIDLNRKWNLISLPIVPFDSDIDTLLATYNASDTAPIDSIWAYDRCSDDWSTYPGAGLTDMTDGPSYWVKVDYSLPLGNAGDYAGGFWYWGVASPMPPDAPSAYDVCEGWNMVGYRALADDDVAAYLWNFAFGTDYGPVYSWDASSQTWNAPLAAGTDDLIVTMGYWIPFAADGTIFPP